ncbi:hypothetical protein ACWEWP_04355 [Streptomyces olivaceus]
MRLVHLGVVFTVVERDERTAGLVERGRTVRFEDAPTDHRRAVGHIRRTAWRLDDLIERLVAHQYLTEARLPFPPAEGRAGRHDSAGTTPVEDAPDTIRASAEAARPSENAAVVAPEGGESGAGPRPVPCSGRGPAVVGADAGHEPQQPPAEASSAAPTAAGAASWTS